MDMATTMFPLKATTTSKSQTLLHRLWPKSVLHDIHAIRYRTKVLRRLATPVAATPDTERETLFDEASPHHKLWTRVTNPLILRTVTSPPIRNLEALSLSHTPDEEDETTQAFDL